jgi:parallel beta-helix repeat protein
MRKITTVIICMILTTSIIGIFSIQTSVADPIHYVNSGESIQAAIDIADPGDTIYVYHGTYTEQINVTKSITLEGENKSNTTINGGFNVTADNTIIQNFTITYGYGWDPDGAERNGTHRAGILVKSSSNTFYNNDIYDIFGGNGSDDPDLGGGAGGSGTGIYLNSSSASEITQNTIYNLHGGNGGGGGSGGPGGNCTGIYLKGSSDIHIIQNTIDDLTGGNGGNEDPGGTGGTSAGIFLESTTSTNITQNTITNITGGLGGDADHGGNGGIGAGIFLQFSNDNILPDNIISKMVNGTGGVGGISNGVDGMGAGLYGNGSDGNTIAHCTITYGYYGILLNSSLNNLCYDNYFSNNDYNAYDDGTNKWNTTETLGTNIIGGSSLGGNYWSNYTGLDGDVDGFGDTPYNISGGSNQDKLPLMNQPPNTPNSPTPANESPDVSVDANLSWSGGDPDSDTVTYDVYFGTSSPPSKVSGNQTDTTYEMGTMDHDTTYYWKIVSWDSNDATAAGPVWNFTTEINNPPNASGSPDPSNNSDVVPVNADISWTCSDPDGDTVKFDVYFGTSNPPPKKASNQTDTTYDTGTMNSTTTYYWRIISWDNHNASNVSPLWNFNTTAPLSNPPVMDPNPDNGTTGVSVSLSILRVTIEDYDGDSFNWTITTSPNIGSSSGTAENNGTKNCSLTVSLTYSKTYYWYVHAYDGTYWTNKTYWFKTVSDSGGGSPGEPPVVILNKKPVAKVSADAPYQGLINTDIIFDGSGSDDPDGNITTWFWTFGDGTNGTGMTVGHSFSNVGTYTVNLTVTDDNDATDSDTASCIIKYQNRPPIKPIVTGPTDGTKNTTYTYTAFSTDADNDTIQYTFDWGESENQSSGYVPNATNYTMNHSWTAAGRYSITVTVSDALLADSTKITIYIDAVQARGVGYLFDNDGDGVYDAFYSDELKQTLSIQKKGDTYLIDGDGDGDTDYLYNETHGITSYKAPRKTPGFECVLVILAIACILFYRRYKIDM